MNYKSSLWFLGGAPKCGTSSIFNWFEKHPSINAVKNKEVFYFIDENSPLKNKKLITLDDYFSQFNTLEKDYYLDGTTHLLFQGVETVNKIKSLDLNTYFVFVLRNPISRLYSSFNYTKNNLLRINKDFSYNDYITCLRTGNSKLLQENITNENSLFVLKNDLEYGRYSQYLPLWYDAFSEKNIKVILFEDLKNNTSQAVNSLCAFLKISSNYFDKFQFNADNETVVIGYRILFKYMKKISFFMPKGAMKNSMKKLFSIKSKARKELLDEENSVFLNHYYSSEVAHLQKIGLDLNFSTWDEK